MQACTICKQIHGSCMQCCKCATYFHATCASRAGYCMEVSKYICFFYLFVCLRNIDISYYRYPYLSCSVVVIGSFWRIFTVLLSGFSCVSVDDPPWWIHFFSWLGVLMTFSSHTSCLLRLICILLGVLSHNFLICLEKCQMVSCSFLDMFFNCLFE